MHASDDGPAPELARLRERVFGSDASASAAEVQRLLELEQGAWAPAPPPRPAAEDDRQSRGGSDAAPEASPARQSRVRHRAGIAGALVAVGLLGFLIGGAVMSPGEPDAFAELAWPQTDEDVIEAVADTDLVPSSTRYLGTVDGFDIYLGLSTESGGACVAVMGRTSGTGWSSGCSDSASPRQTFGVMNMRGLQVVAGRSEQLVSDGPVEEIPLSENVTVYRRVASTGG